VFNDGIVKTSFVLTTLGVRSGSCTANALKQKDMEVIQKAEIVRLSEHHKRSKKKPQCTEKKIKRVQMIQIVVLGSIKGESVLLFVIILKTLSFD
jgi:2-phosphoglycerate kinase